MMKDDSLDALLRSHNDLVLSIHRSVVDMYTNIKSNVDILSEEIKDMKLSMKQIVVDQKYYFDAQERRHEAEIKRILSTNIKTESIDDKIDNFLTNNDVKAPIPLPEVVEVKTGEEKEEVIFVARCKLYCYDQNSKENKERGIGDIKILKNKDTKSYRCVMRSDSTLKVCANFQIVDGMKVETKLNVPTACSWACKNLNQDGKQVDEVFCARFKEVETVKEFCRKFMEAVKENNNGQGITINTTISPQKSLVENFSFVKQSDVKNTNKPKDINSNISNIVKSTDEKKQTSFSVPDSKANNFSKVFDSGNQTSTFTSFASMTNKTPKFTFVPPTQDKKINNASAFTFEMPTKPASVLFGQKIDNFVKDEKKEITKKNESDGSDNETDEFVPTDNFKPVIPLPELVEVKSGEEGEDVEFSARCKLYRYDRDAKENKERGLGEIKILKNKITGKFRCIMRREQVLKICANFQIVEGMKITPKANVPSAYTWACKDFSQDESGIDEVFCARFREVEVAKNFCRKFEEGVKAAVDENTVTTNKTASPQKVAVENFSFVKQEEPKSVENFSFVKQEDPKSAEKNKNTTFTSPISAEKNKNTNFTSPISAEKNKNTSFNSPKPAEQPKLFGNSAKTTEPPKIFGGGAKNSLTFASISSKDPPLNFSQLFQDNKSSSSAFSFAKGAKPVPLFQKVENTKKNESDGSDNETEDFVPTDDFKPVIPLPELIEVKSGEEGEEVVFNARCKLYRFDRETKENKERGLGEIKILKNLETKRFRCIMRREQVLKICANFQIVEGMKITPKANVPSAYTWACKDFSQDESGIDEVFCARFREVETAKDFCRKFEDAAKGAENVAIQSPSNPTTKPENSNKNLNNVSFSQFKNFTFTPPQTKKPDNDVKKEIETDYNKSDTSETQENFRESDYENEDEEDDEDDDYIDVNDVDNVSEEEEEEDALFMEHDCKVTFTDVSSSTKTTSNKNKPINCKFEIYEVKGLVKIVYSDKNKEIFTHYIYNNSKVVQKNSLQLEYVAYSYVDSSRKNLDIVFGDDDAFKNFNIFFQIGVAYAKELSFDENSAITD